MRLTTTTNVSVDGVMQGLGGPDEDRSGGFDRGGWAIPLLDTEAGDYLNQVYGDAAAFLFGRRTYEIFAAYWGAMADPSTNPIAAAGRFFLAKLPCAHSAKSGLEQPEVDRS